MTAARSEASTDGLRMADPSPGAGRAGSAPVHELTAPGPVAIGSPEMYQAIVESSVSPFVVVDSSGIIRWAGPQTETLLGEPAEHYVGRHFMESIAESSHEVAVAAFVGFVEAPELQPWIGPPMLLDLVRADGTQVACEVAATRGGPHGVDGAILHVRRWRGTVLLYEAVDALAGGAPLDQVLGHLIELLEHDSPGSAASVAVGWDGKTWASVIHGPTARAAADVLDGPAFGSADGMAVALDRPQVTALSDLGPATAGAADRAGFADCWVFPVTVRGEVSASAALVVWRTLPGPPQPYLTTTPQRVRRLVALAIEAAETRASWQAAAFTDELTGLATRAALDDHLAAIDPEAGARTLLFCDLDGFKAVNDRLGHGAGDRVLQIVAGRIRGAVRPQDLVIRWGGDEFAVLCSGSIDAAVLAERIITRVNEPVVIDQHRLQLGISIGVAMAEPDIPVSDLLERGDEALRQAKADGKNRWLTAC